MSGPNATPRALVALTKARKMLAEAKSLDDWQGVRSTSKAVLEWAKAQRDMGMEARNEASEIMLIAERRIGKMLQVFPKHEGGRPSETSTTREPVSTLADVGIGKKQSSRWQSMARVPEEQFRLWVDETREAGKELTEGALIKLGRQGQHRKEWAGDLDPIEGTVANLDDLVDDGSKFRCVYADPPWAYSNQETRASTDNHYFTMTVEEICQEPVLDLVADDAHLHLWTTNAFLFDAQRVIAAWGFEYRSCFIWVKPQMGIGNYWRVSHEFLLLGIRGKATNFLANDQPSWGSFNRTSHSRKPKEVRALIEKVSPGPYLELYGRERLPGWTVYGNQIDMKPLLDGT